MVTALILGAAAVLVAAWIFFAALILASLRNVPVLSDALAGSEDDDDHGLAAPIAAGAERPRAERAGAERAGAERAGAEAASAGVEAFPDDGAAARRSPGSRVENPIDSRDAEPDDPFDARRDATFSVDLQRYARGNTEDAAQLGPLTVVVTARDEAASIETTVRRLLAQRYPGLHIVVVDDRSSDATGDILDRIAAEPPGAHRLEVIHNRALPDGWLGKCHACRVGAERAGGEWILFTDGDVALARDDLLARVMRFATRRRLDHVAVLPDMGTMTLLQYALVSAFGQVFLIGTRAFEMHRDLRRGGAGVGAFNLVRRSAYESIGGHEPLRMDPGDDVKLGMLLREAGARQRLYEGTGLVLCPWHRGTLNVLRGLEKNAFSGCQYSVTLLTVFSTLSLGLALGPLALAAAGAALWAAGAIGHGALAASFAPALVESGLLVTGFALVGRRHQTPRPAAALLHPLAMVLLNVALWNSAVRTLARGGMSWRGSFYPLDALRRGLVRPGAGRRTLAR